MSVELVIFDCDGVLFQSEAANIAFYNAVLQQAGEPPLGDTGEAACHALASAQLFEKYFGDRPPVLAKIREVAQSIDYRPFFPLMTPRDDLYDVLERLSSRYRLAMATNRGKTVEQLLDHFEIRRFFDLAVGVYDVERPKPHPDMLLKCLEHFSLGEDRAVYVGDQETDRESAAAARIAFVAMGAVVSDAELRVHQLAELEALLPRL
jgi:phosphoglycolate phosphatase-like HAD superfamily hydrolase